MRFTVNTHSTGNPVAGLINVARDNANLMRLIPEKSLIKLEVGQGTKAKGIFDPKGCFSYFIVRTE